MCRAVFNTVEGADAVPWWVRLPRFSANALKYESPPMIEINGAAHFVLTISQFDTAKEFYCEFLPFLGLQKVYEGNNSGL